MKQIIVFLPKNRSPKGRAVPASSNTSSRAASSSASFVIGASASNGNAGDLGDLEKLRLRLRRLSSERLGVAVGVGLVFVKRRERGVLGALENAAGLVGVIGTESASSFEGANGRMGRVKRSLGGGSGAEACTGVGGREVAEVKSEASEFE
jgi:hypothetical protein